MTHDLVIVPTYHRPEYLELCLEAIRVAKGERNLNVWVCHDRKNRVEDLSDTELVVRANRMYGLPIELITREPHCTVGNLNNFLSAYAAAYNSRARYVYCIEDDVLPAPDFFYWHEAVQARADYFCSVAWHCIRNPRTEKSADPHAIIESTCDYSSIGVCWKREKLAEIVKHATPEYYAYPPAYLAKHFPRSPIPPNQWVEQAGLIMRVLLAGAGTVAWAARPRCAHVGIKGYHRRNGHVFAGTLTQRIERLREAITTGQIKQLGPDFDDINTLEETLPWEAKKLHVAQRHE